MTKLLEQVLTDIRALSPGEQDRVAEVVLDFLRVRGDKVVTFERRKDEIRARHI